jgi:hypothetical protein
MIFALLAFWLEYMVCDDSTSGYHKAKGASKDNFDSIYYLL